TTSHQNTEEEGPKYKSTVSLKGNRESDGFREEKKNYKLKETGYIVERPRAAKDKHKEDNKNAERTTTKDRLLASTLVHSVKKEQEFQTIFDHIKLPQAIKSTSESFIQHIVSLVHHVKEQYFKSAAVTLNRRFTSYKKATEEYSARQKSPEIHRRTGISPSALRKHTHLAGEDRVFKEENQKGDKKLRCDSTDLWHDIDRWRKERTSPSPSFQEEKESKKEREEEFKTHHELKEYSDFGGVSRPRGTFHDDRDDGVDYWAKRGRGHGTFQHGRGCFNFKKSGSSPKWTHEKYQGDGIVEDEEETMENNEEKKDRYKEEKE
ncbi:bcl-2-associated transcription, partial [Lynx pardinus]